MIESPLPKSVHAIGFQEYVNQAVEFISKLSTEENYLYQHVQTPPVICTPRSGPTDITFKYFDMRKFFEFEKATKAYFMRKDGTRNCIDELELNK